MKVIIGLFKMKLCIAETDS